jgi:hypothetical protein
MLKILISGQFFRRSVAFDLSLSDDFRREKSNCPTPLKHDFEKEGNKNDSKLETEKCCDQEVSASI